MYCQSRRQSIQIVAVAQSEYGEMECYILKLRSTLQASTGIVLNMQTQEKLRFLEDKWDERVADGLDGPELLRYRSNILGSDLRITNFGGGNTSSKLEEVDPLEGSKKTVLWIKGSGGDIGSIQRKGFATLYLEKLHALAERYRGVQFEDEMVEMYPLCTFGNNSVAASIDTPLHGFLPFEHVDHLIRTGELRWRRRQTARKRWRNLVAHSGTN
jgi:rhamnose utilization protein RhaD (predicted bifunctional aldolase and dehydrogenase)